MTHNNMREEMIYYTGIGSNNLLSIFSEKRFRNILLINQNNFNELCPYDHLTCDINVLTAWCGAEIIKVHNFREFVTSGTRLFWNHLENLFAK
jgi:hypothetical protein